jgi:hypothetical protein
MILGGLDLTGKAAVLKTAGLPSPWGFESLVLRQLANLSTCKLVNFFGEVTELAEGARLLSVCPSKGDPGFESQPLR